MCLLPLLLVQALFVRRIAIRLPAGKPPANGVEEQGEALIRLVGVGDSVIAGTGVEMMTDSLTAQVASELAASSGCTVHWQAMGTNGDTVDDLMRKTAAADWTADVVLVSVGVNDVTQLTSLVKWQLGLTELIPALKQRSALVVFMGVPPMEFFTALPQPLRWVLGVRAAMLDKSLQQAADLVPGICWVGAATNFQADHLAEDGYHPNQLACQELAVQVAETIGGKLPGVLE